MGGRTSELDAPRRDDAAQHPLLSALAKAKKLSPFSRNAAASRRRVRRGRSVTAPYVMRRRHDMLRSAFLLARR